INPELLDEFTPELLSHANAVRARIQHLAVPAASRAEMNRANAQHSTGPRSDTGKLASCRNSLKHGLASGTLLIPGEDPAAFDFLLENLLSEHQPADTTEQMLIHEMAQSFWLAQRALGLQNECFTADGVDERRLSLFMRYHTTHERAFHKALNTLIRMQKDRRKSDLAASRGFVSQSAISTSVRNGFVRQNAPPETTETGFVRQNPPHLRPEMTSTLQKTEAA
ncbi:MAG: hypothetical protein JOZ22_08125, partial [Acidobacteriia bacterium]|nr:hypothetical protein [Terriglobia bacterium]